MRITVKGVLVFIGIVISLLLAASANATVVPPKPQSSLFRTYPTGKTIRADEIMHEPSEQRPMRRNWYLRWNNNNVWSQWRDKVTGRTYLCTGDGRVCQYTGHRILREWLRF